MAKLKLVVVGTKNHTQLKKRGSRSDERAIIKILALERNTSDFSHLQRTTFRNCTPRSSRFQTK